LRILFIKILYKNDSIYGNEEMSRIPLYELHGKSNILWIIEGIIEGIESFQYILLLKDNREDLMHYII
jgi:hypothetical protein